MGKSKGLWQQLNNSHKRVYTPKGLTLKDLKEAASAVFLDSERRKLLKGLTALFDNKKISGSEAETLIKMINSPDPENMIVAEAIMIEKGYVEVVESEERQIHFHTGPKGMENFHKALQDMANKITNI